MPVPIRSEQIKSVRQTHAPPISFSTACADLACLGLLQGLSFPRPAEQSLTPAWFAVGCLAGARDSWACAAQETVPPTWMPYTWRPLLLVAVPGHHR